MPKAVDISGKQFGRLTAIRRDGSNVHGHVLWDCVCQCGRRSRVEGTSLRKGATKSCGCLHREVAAQTQIAKAMPLEDKVRARRVARAKQHARRRTDPLVAMQARLSRLHRHALAAVGAPKTSPTLESLGYTLRAFVAHIERQFLPGMGWNNLSRWHVDHIIPISTAKTKADVVALNQLSNLRPLWSVQNLEKRARRTLLL